MALSSALHGNTVQAERLAGALNPAAFAYESVASFGFPPFPSHQPAGPVIDIHYGGICCTYQRNCVLLHPTVPYSISGLGSARTTHTVLPDSRSPKTSGLCQSSAHNPPPRALFHVFLPGTWHSPLTWPFTAHPVRHPTSQWLPCCRHPSRPR